MSPRDSNLYNDFLGENNDGKIWNSLNRKLLNIFISRNITFIFGFHQKKKTTKQTKK